MTLSGLQTAAFLLDEETEGQVFSWACGDYGPTTDGEIHDTLKQLEQQNDLRTTDCRYEYRLTESGYERARKRLQNHPNRQYIKRLGEWVRQRCAREHVIALITAYPRFQQRALFETAA